MRRANLGARTRAPHKTFALNAVPETGGLGDRSRNLSADTIAVEIDLVRRPFQVLLRSHPIDFALSYLSSRSTRGPTSVVPQTYSPFGRLLIFFRAATSTGAQGSATCATRHCANAAAWDAGRFERRKGEGTREPRSTACSISLFSKHTHLT